MAMVKIYKCKRCKHDWAGRLPRLPRVCPGCNSPYWNKARRTELTIEQRKEIEIYKHLKNSFPFWQLSAQMLLEAAASIKPVEPVIHEHTVGKTGLTPIPNLLSVIPYTYYMLIGFALENYYKGAIIGNMILDGNQMQDTKLDEAIAKHNLNVLAEDAGVEIKENSASILQEITECIIWKGRYPIPDSAKRIGNLKLTPHNIVQDDSPYISEKDIQRIIIEAQKHYSKLKKKVYKGVQE